MLTKNIYILLAILAAQQLGVWQSCGMIMMVMLLSLLWECVEEAAKERKP